MREYLKKMREKFSFTQNDVAEELLISRTGYANIENGERQKNMTISIIVKLAKLYGMKPSEVMEMEEEYQKSLNTKAQ